MVRAYSPTISSFYTKSSRTPPQRPRRFDSGSLSTIVTGNPVSEYTNIKLTKGWLLNRSDNITSYLCLKSHLIQSIINKFTLILILITVHLKLYGSFISYNLESLQTVSDVRCQSGDAESMVGSFYDLMHSYQAISANVTLMNVHESVDTQMDTLLVGYQAVLQAGIQSAVDASENSTKAIHDWVEQKLDDANSQTSKQINRLEKSLSDIEAALNGSALISTDGLGSASKISLDGFKFEVSQSLSTKLANAKSSFGKHSDSLSDTNKQFKGYVDGNFTSLYTDLNDKAKDNKKNTSANNFCEQSKDLYKTLGTTTDITTRNSIIAYSILAILAIIPVAYCEYIGWHYRLQITNKLEQYGGGVQDAMEYTSKMEYPILNMILNSIPGGKIDISSDDLILCRWWINFIFSKSCQFLLGTVIALMLSYFGQIGVINGLKSAINHSNIANSTAQKIQQFTGADFTDLYSTAATNAANTLEEYQKSLEKTTNNALNDAGLPSSTIKPLETMTFVSALMTIQSDNTTLSATHYLNNYDDLSPLVDQLSYISNSFLVTALVLLGAWILLVFGACHYVAYRHFKLTKR